MLKKVKSFPYREPAESPFSVDAKCNLRKGISLPSSQNLLERGLTAQQQWLTALALKSYSSGLWNFRQVLYLSFSFLNGGYANHSCLQDYYEK